MNQFKKVAFHTLGCKLNFSETSTIARLFENNGFAKVDFFDSPDIFVINTCSVTNNADKECRMIVRKALRQNPAAFVVVIGCYAQLKPNEVASMDGVDLVLGANEKFNILDYVSNLEKEKTGRIIYSEIKEVKEFFPSFSQGDRTRSFLKVQDGCDYFCSFCTIPLARGRSRSNSVAETIKVAREVIATGVKEIVLTGVNIGDFGQSIFSQNSNERPEMPQQKKDKNQNGSFLELIKELDTLSSDNEKHLEGELRFRISSIEPNLLTDEIIEFVAASKKFAPHFHIPLQSGSNKILNQMRRRYEKELYADRIKKIKKLIPHCCIGADVIVGFPGETEDDFLETYNFINELDISYLHVFTYSERVNTTAVRMNEIVPIAERNKRNKMLQILSEKKKQNFYRQNIGKELNVLFEGKIIPGLTDESGEAVNFNNLNGEGFMYGFTENYLRVKSEYNPSLVNRIAKFKLEEVDRDGLFFVPQILPVESLLPA